MSEVTVEITGKTNIVEDVTDVTVQIASSGPQGIQGPTGPQGRSVTSIARTAGNGAPGTIDTFTITYSDATTSTFTVYNGSNGTNGTNGRGITSIARTSGTGAAGSTDTYTITYTDSTTSTFTVVNGTNGAQGPSGVVSVVAPIINRTGSSTNAVIDIDNIPQTLINGVAVTTWAPSTAYAKGALVQYLGETYRRKAAGTSTSTFDPSMWDQQTPDAASTNTANNLVLRDSSGNFASNQITANALVVKAVTGQATIQAATGPTVTLTTPNSDGTILTDASTIAVAKGGTGATATTGTGNNVLSTAPTLTNASAGVLYRGSGTPAALSSGTSVTLSFANITSQIIVVSGTTLTTLTLPSATTMTSNWQGNDFTFIEFSIVNTSSNSLTLANGASHTVTGSATIAAGTSARFASRLSTSSLICYRLA